MARARPIRLTALVGGAMLALAGLVGCALDREAMVRAQLDQWVELGDTTYFESSTDCTLGMFEVETVDLSPDLQRVPSVRQGLLLLGHDLAVAFDIEGRPPTQISEDVMRADRHKALGLLSSGIAAKNCMTPKVTQSYVTALRSEQAILIFDPTNNALAVLDRLGGRIFYARSGVI